MAGRDREWMGQALALAATVEGSTSPNPRVGCLLVSGDEVVGRGRHRVAGGPHAEAVALAEAGERARGATLYVSLEPCAHHGRTPPCVDLLLAAGVSRVVAALKDPDPRVDGRGFARLREHGVEVDVGLLDEPAHELNAPFMKHHAAGRPLVTLKVAGSLDGLISARGGEARWITGPAARRFAHRLRLRHDAVLVGAATVRRDDPRLTVRLPGVQRQPLRVVLSGRLDFDANAAVFDDRAPTRVYTVDGAPRERLPEGVDAREVPTREGQADLEAVLRDLAEDGVQSVLVEGGGRTLATFLRAGLADRAALFSAPRAIGAQGATPMLDMPAAATPAAGWRVSRDRLIVLGPDLLLLGRIHAPRESGG